MRVSTSKFLSVIFLFNEGHEKGISLVSIVFKNCEYSLIDNNAIKLACRLIIVSKYAKLENLNEIEKNDILHRLLYLYNLETI